MNALLIPPPTVIGPPTAIGLNLFISFSSLRSPNRKVEVKIASLLVILYFPHI